MNYKIKLTSLLIIIFSCLGYSQSFDNSDLEHFLQKYVSNEGVPDYEKIIKNEKSLQEIINGLAKIAPNGSWLKSEVKAYWINVYNLNMLKLVADYYPLKSVQYIQDPLNIEFINVNGTKVSLDHIENVIIQELGDPRAFFALSKGCVSSPVLKNTAYTPENIDVQLDEAVKTFINDSSKNRFSNTSGDAPDKAALSSVFEWHMSDIDGLVIFLNKYLEGMQLKKEIDIRFSAFDWTLYN